MAALVSRSSSWVLILSGLLWVGVPGCTKPESSAKQEDRSIFGKKTQEIGEFNPEAGAKVSDSSIDEDRLATPLIGAAAAYGPLLERVAKLGIQQAINFFYAEHGRFPKNHQEFMEQIIEKNNIQLPVLPGGAQYQYDVEKHELVVIEGEKKNN